ncbi:lytic transglycosylase domain-containing protein [Sphingobium sp. AN558]|uniref:lytic transglycosylase domain-containing protein n=1 Tax=Sphingobium sp. AN558 TaxID=3133442 RepID=UPI0030C154EF
MRKWLAGIGIGALLMISDSVSAKPPRNAAQETRVASCISRAAAGRPWLELTLFAIREQEGGWVGAQVPNDNGSVDLGPMQVNSSWVPRVAKIVSRQEEDVRRWLRHDACFNVDVSRWIFLSALNDARDFWRAVGIYHSPTRWRQIEYARRVAVIMRSLANPKAVSAAP